MKRSKLMKKRKKDLVNMILESKTPERSDPKWRSLDISKLPVEEFQMLHDIGSYTGMEPELKTARVPYLGDTRRAFRLTTRFVHGAEDPILCEWTIEGHELVVLLRHSKNRVMLDHRRDAKPEALER